MTPPINLGILASSITLGPPVASLKGYIAGGEGSGGETNTVQKIDFASNTYSGSTTSLSAAKKYTMAYSNPAFAGYVTGGTGGTGSIDKFTYPTDSRSSLSLNSGTTEGAAYSNDGVAGYTLNANSSTGQKLNYSNDSVSTLSGYQEFPAVDLTTGFANTGVAGYRAGGFVSGTGGTNSVSKYIFSNDTGSVLSTGLVTGEFSVSSMSNHGVAGYVGFDNNINKFSFPTDTRTTISGANGNAAGTGYFNTGVRGYFSGGQTFGNPKGSTIQIAFPTDTASSGPSISGRYNIGDGGFQDA